MVQKLEDYKWCSYGEAMQPKNNKQARAGLCRVLERQKTVRGRTEDKSGSAWNEGVGGHYRMMLFSDGEEVFVDQPESGEVNRRVRKGFKRKLVKKVLAGGGKLTFGEALRCRVRYFSDGVAVGSRDFVDGVFKGSRVRFGDKRKTGARPMRGVGWKQKQARLYTMRQLRSKPLG